MIDHTDSIDALSDAEFLFTARIEEIRQLSPRVAMYAARRWCRIKYPDDSPDLHRIEATEMFMGFTPRH